MFHTHDIHGHDAIRGRTTESVDATPTKNDRVTVAR